MDRTFDVPQQGGVKVQATFHSNSGRKSPLVGRAKNRSPLIDDSRSVLLVQWNVADRVHKPFKPAAKSNDFLSRAFRPTSQRLE